MLDRLPTELIDKIFEYLDIPLWSHRHLLLICKRLKAVAEKRLYRDVAVTWSDYGQNVLTNIAESGIGQHVRNLYIASGQLPSGGDIHAIHRQEDEQGTSTYVKRPASQRTGCEGAQSLVNSARTFRVQRLHIYLQVQPHHDRKLLQFLESHILLGVLQAAKDSPALRELYLVDINQDPIPCRKCHPKNAPHGEARRNLSELRILDIVSSERLFKSCLQSLWRFCPRLRTLRWYSPYIKRGGWMDRRLENPLSKVPGNGLREIVLGSITIPAPDLVQLLHYGKDTVRSVSLMSVSVSLMVRPAAPSTENSWEAVFSCLADMPALVEFESHSLLYRRRHGTFQIGGWDIKGEFTSNRLKDFHALGDMFRSINKHRAEASMDPYQLDEYKFPGKRIFTVLELHSLDDVNQGFAKLGQVISTPLTCKVMDREDMGYPKSMPRPRPLISGRDADDFIRYVDNIGLIEGPPDDDW